MSRRLLLGVVVVLIVTNITTLLAWNKDENVAIDGTKAKIDSGKPVATIGDEEISYNDWMQSLRDVHGKSLLKQLVDHKLVGQLASKRNIEVNEKVIDREIALLTTMQGIMTEEETEVKEKKWRKNIVYRYQLMALLAEDTMVDESEIRAYYNGYQKQYDFQASMQISHIVVSDFKTAKKVIKELNDGASFKLLANEYSIDEETKSAGGYLGFFVNSSQFLPNGYEEIAQEMEQRSYSEPFKSDRGVSIIYLHRKLPSITFTYDEIKPYVKEELALEKNGLSLTANSLWDNADIEWVFE
ncbi:peptidylprolyl isomerase [Lentibacillus sp. Marseille-P4043]|uniref:peptidylprolyl isomerase n=1 Tax=Lentibacillus sp. Marseille-P4043 TaxID=2040293 RepID=UPI000D0B952B|nr:peptidylprolyl isomerase [Lentibacillus sp. Marseille-P4043]